MVSYRHRGFRDWLAQRITAIILGAYAIFLVSYLLTHAPVNYDQWHALFQTFWLRLFTIAVLVSVLWHGWIGLWTVSTDYIKPRCVQVAFQAIVLCGLLAYLIWGFSSLFG